MSDAVMSVAIDGRQAQAGASQVSKGLEDIKVKAGQADSSINKIDGSFNRLKQTAFNLKGVMGALAGVISVSAFANLIKNSVEAADRLNDLSKRTGIAIEQISAFNYVAKLSGTSIESFTTGIRSMQQNMAQAASGAKEAQESFRKLGVNFQELRNLSPDQQFTILADKIDSLESPAERTAAAMAVFGRAGQELIPVMEGGAESIREMLAEAGKMGAVFSEEEALKIEGFNDKIDSLKMGIEGLGRDAFIFMYDSFFKIGAVLAKAWNNFEGFWNGIVKATWAAIYKIRDAISALGKDLGNFFSNPFKFSGFTNLKAEMQKSIGDAFKDAFANEFNSAGDFNEAIDKVLDEKLKPKSKRRKNVILGGAPSETIKEVQDTTKDSLKKVQEEIEKQNEETRREFMRPFETAFENIQNKFTDFFEKAFSGGINSFKDLASGIKQIFIRLAAELATLNLFKGLGLSASGLAGMVGMSGGMSGGGIGNMLSGGGFNFTSIPGLSSAPSFLLDNFGVSLGTGMGITNAIGGAGLGGFAGSIISGLVGGNKTGGSIGGSIGGALGSLIPIPGGSIIGSIAGSLLGSVFGNKKPSSKLQGGYIDLAGGSVYGAYGLSGKKFSQENQDAAFGVLQQSQAIAGLISKATGQALTEKLRVEFGGRDGYSFQLGGGELKTVGNDAAKAIEEITKQMLSLTDAAKRFNLEGKSAEQIMETLNFRAVYDDLVKEAKAFAYSYDLEQSKNKISLLEEEARAYEQAKNKWQSYADSLSKSINSLLLDKNLTNLSPAARLLEARNQFLNVSGKAASGDEGAIAQLESSGRSLLEASKEYYASSEQYFADFELVKSTLAQAGSYAQSQVNIQSALLSSAQSQLAETQKQTAAIEKMIADLQTKVKAGPWDKVPDSALLRSTDKADILNGYNPINLLPERLVRQLKTLAGFNFNTDSGSFADFAKSNPSAGSLFNSLVAQLGGKTQAFAAGGYASPGFAMVGEQGPELVRFGSGARVYNTGDTSRILSAANDNKNVENILQRILIVMAKSGDASIGTLEAIEKRLSALEATKRRENAA